MILSGSIGGLEIPSHAAAFPPAMLKDFASVPTSVPRRVHLLLFQAGGWADLAIAQEFHAESEGPKATTESIYQFATGQLD